MDTKNAEVSETSSALNQVDSLYLYSAGGGLCVRWLSILSLEDYTYFFHCLSTYLYLSSMSPLNGQLNILFNYRDISKREGFFFYATLDPISLSSHNSVK